MARSGRREAAREFLVFSGSSIAYQASRLVVQLIAAAILAPADFGVWGVVVIVLLYTTHANLGVLSGANRQIPILLGSRRPDEASLVEDAALTGSLIAGGLAGTVGLVAGLAIGGAWTAVAVPLALAILVQQAYLASQVSLRGRLDFGLASAQQFFLAVLFLVVGAVAVTQGGVAGLAAAQALAFGLGAVVVFPWRRSVRVRADRARIAALMRDGLPIMLSGLAFALATSIDRWVIAATGDAVALGHYVLASTLSSSLLFVSLVVAQQAYPRMAILHGAGGSRADLDRAARRQGTLAVGLMALPALALVVGAPVLIPLALPSYTPAIGALQATAIAYLILAAGSGYANMLVAIGRAWRLLAIQVATAVLGALLGWLALRAGLGLTGVATAMAFAFAGFVIATIVVGRRG